jgi:hypothetical protein
MKNEKTIEFDIIALTAERERERERVRFASPCTKDGCAATITTRYGAAMGPSNIISLKHYPMTAIIELE